MYNGYTTDIQRIYDGYTPEISAINTGVTPCHSACIAPGSRVFIRIRQLLDGRYGFPAQTDALVPGKWQSRPATA